RHRRGDQGDRSLSRRRSAHRAGGPRGHLPYVLHRRRACRSAKRAEGGGRVSGASVLRKALRDQRWQVLGFGVALFVMAFTSVLLWPNVRDTLQNLELPKAVQAFLGNDLNIATPAGYLSARYFGWVEILLIVYALISGTGDVAGAESADTIDLLISWHVSR